MDKIPCLPSVGADVEWFLYHKTYGTVVPACGLIGGTKEEPLDLGGGYAVQEDNVMVEWNVPPAERWDMFYHNIVEGIDLVQNHIAENLGKEYKMVCRSENLFEPIDLESDQAKTFGCEPDFDAYLGGVQRPDGARDILGTYRTCGGHIHLGGDFQCPDFVAALFAELFIGVFAYLPMDFNTVRQKWYGQPGVFRSKPYGIEYRTPDNQWTKDRGLIEYVAMHAYACAEWLTNTRADELQRIFRLIPWVELRRYMSGEKRSQQQRKMIYAAAVEAGVPA